MNNRVATDPAVGGLRDALIAAVTVYVTAKVSGVDAELGQAAGQAAGNMTGEVFSAGAGVVVGFVTFFRKLLMDRLAK